MDPNYKKVEDDESEISVKGGEGAKEEIDKEKVKKAIAFQISKIQRLKRKIKRLKEISFLNEKRIKAVKEMIVELEKV